MGHSGDSWGVHHCCSLSEARRVGEALVYPFTCTPVGFTAQPASAKWYDRGDYIFVKFCVEDSKDVNGDFEKSTLTLVVLEEVIILNIYIKLIFFTGLIQMILNIKEWTDRFYVVYKKGDSGQSWPRLTKNRAKSSWLSVDFNIGKTGKVIQMKTR